MILDDTNLRSFSCIEALEFLTDPDMSTEFIRIHVWYFPERAAPVVTVLMFHDRYEMRDHCKSSSFNLITVDEFYHRCERFGVLDGRPVGGGFCD